ncbi:hypothetical protein, partial [Escherichia coli]|uniref:hypothetical protein n=1 Tax=Escherichia coli TaxID=562 RepID=UPI001923BB33
AESGHVAEQVGVRIHNGHITVEQGHDSGHVAEQTREAASADGTSRVHITDSTVVAANIAGRGHVGSLNYSSATASGDAVARAKAQQRDLADQAGGSATASASASTSEQRGPEPSRPVNAFAAAAARESGHERGGFER